MTKVKFTVLLLLSGLCVSFSGAVGNRCLGFLPENNMKIPVSLNQEGGITEEQFNAVLDKAEKYYSDVIKAKGATLQVNRLWKDDTVNASATQFGTTWVLNMYGGLARHSAITADGFMLVACHELGHHLGGAPKTDGYFGSWATNEGGADYYTGVRCFHYMFNDDQENADWVANNTVDDVLKSTCESTWNTQAEENRCMRAGTAGMSVTTLFKELKDETTDPKFDTPDPNQVAQTDDSHPETQCRLDTYYQSALCASDMGELSDTDYHQSTCTALNSQVGLRPRCWFKPDEASPLSLAPQASN